MRNFVVVFILALFSTLFAVQQEMVVTQPEKGMQIISEITSNQHHHTELAIVNSRDSRLELNWQTSDPSAIAGEVSVSGTTMNSLIQWHLNAERISLYHDSPVPVWEHIVGDLDFGYPIDQLTDGSILATGDGTTIKIFDP